MALVVETAVLSEWRARRPEGWPKARSQKL